ncbi:MAG TPA: hypothetical protein VNN15_05845, partial [Solirubrobacterales bacterium]|nr:hypothetical protein [Solirubrobacterales bacterium]
MIGDWARSEGESEEDKEKENERKEAQRKAIKVALAAIGGELGNYVEQRRRISLKQGELICHRRLLSLTGSEQEVREITQAKSTAMEGVGDLRQERVTIFSQIQRRNLTKEEFLAEMEAITKGVTDHAEATQ